MYEKSWPILYSKLCYKMDQDFLDTVYTCALILIHRIFEDWGIGWGMGHLNTYNLAIFK